MNAKWENHLYAELNQSYKIFSQIQQKTAEFNLNNWLLHRHFTHYQFFKLIVESMAILIVLFLVELLLCLFVAYSSINQIENISNEI